MGKSTRLGWEANLPTMSSNRKKAESIASSMIILVDFDGAIATDTVRQKASSPGVKRFPRQ